MPNEDDLVRAFQASFEVFKKGRSIGHTLLLAATQGAFGQFLFRFSEHRWQGWYGCHGLRPIKAEGSPS